MRKYNYQAFTPNDIKKGLHLDLLKYLFEYNNKSENSYYDIHITSDGYCTIVEWINRYYNEESGAFTYVDEDQVVMTEKYFPDNSCVYVSNEDEWKEKLDEWLKENPGYVQDEYGRYYRQYDSIEDFLK